MSLPSRQQRGGAERQLETQSHHAQSALGLPQVGGETTNAKPNCDLLGPLNNWEKKTVGLHSLFPCRVVPQHAPTKKHNCVLSPARCRPEAPLRSCCPRLPTRGNWTPGTRGQSATFFSQNVSRSFLFNHSCLPSQHAELHGNVASVGGGHELL